MDAESTCDCFKYKTRGLGGETGRRFNLTRAPPESKQLTGNTTTFTGKEEQLVLSPSCCNGGASSLVAAAATTKYFTVPAEEQLSVGRSSGLSADGSAQLDRAPPRD